MTKHMLNNCTLKESRTWLLVRTWHCYFISFNSEHPVRFKKKIHWNVQISGGSTPAVFKSEGVPTPATPRRRRPCKTSKISQICTQNDPVVTKPAWRKYQMEGQKYSFAPLDFARRGGCPSCPPPNPLPPSWHQITFWMIDIMWKSPPRLEHLQSRSMQYICREYRYFVVVIVSPA